MVFLVPYQWGSNQPLKFSETNFSTPVYFWPKLPSLLFGGDYVIDRRLTTFSLNLAFGSVVKSAGGPNPAVIQTSVQIKRKNFLSIKKKVREEPGSAA